MECTVEQRNAVREAAQQLADLPDVVAVDVLEPDTGHRPGWTLEATIANGKVGPVVLRVLVAAGCSLDEVATRGEYRVLIATG